MLLFEVLNNDAVLRMTRAGLATDIIMLKIDSSEAAFDTTADGLIALKSAGVADDIIRAMMRKARVNAPAVTPARLPLDAAPRHTDSTCAVVSYYTTATNGWSWIPSSTCVSANGTAIDEEVLAAKGLIATCTTKAAPPPIGDGQQEWWIAAPSGTYKVKSTPEVLRRLVNAASSALPM